MLRIFSPLKNPTASAGFEPANLGTKGQHATPRPPKPLPDIILKDKQVTYISGVQFLGVLLEHDLNWDCHVENLIVKLSKLFFAIKTIRSFVNKNIVKTMCVACLHSSLKYGILFRGNTRNLKKN